MIYVTMKKIGAHAVTRDSMTERGSVVAEGKVRSNRYESDVLKPMMWIENYHAHTSDDYSK